MGRTTEIVMISIPKAFIDLKKISAPVKSVPNQFLREGADKYFVSSRFTMKDLYTYPKTQKNTKKYIMTRF